MTPPTPRRRDGGATLAAFVLLASALTIGCGGKEATKKEDELHREAQIAISEGKIDEAIDKLTQSLDVKPTFYSYFTRGWLYSQQGKDREALADCAAGLELEPANTDLKWLMGETKKPLAQRFKGRNQNPPSSSK
jgi:tetratricopeptide (TPR) repeat protein